jgi:hypothetical protein
MAAVLVIGLLGYLLDSCVRLIQQRYAWTVEAE